MRALSSSSRFHATRVILSEGGEEMFAEWSPPKPRAVGERLYVVTQADLDRPYLIAWRMYGDVNLWWLIMWHNRIIDPLTLSVGDKLVIPDYKFLIPSVTDRASGDTASEVAEIGAPPIVRPYAIPPFQRLLDVVTAAPPETAIPYAFNYGFLIPQVSATGVHFQMELSVSEQFASVALSKTTSQSVSRWHYYNPFANGGAGAHLDFPSGGVDANALFGHPVYFGLTGGDGLVEGRLYYVRHRAIIGGTPALWNSPPPFVMRHKA